MLSRMPATSKTTWKNLLPLSRQNSYTNYDSVVE